MHVTTLIFCEILGVPTGWYLEDEDEASDSVSGDAAASVRTHLRIRVEGKVKVLYTTLIMIIASLSEYNPFNPLSALESPSTQHVLLESHDPGGTCF